MTSPAVACRILASVATALAAVALHAGPVGAAPTAECAGVTVLVDPGELGGTPAATCVTEEAASAAELFEAAGVELSWVQRQPGAVCQVDGRPADLGCVAMPPGDAYWGLFWADDPSGTWAYATRGAGSLVVPDGGAVAFAWQSTGTRTPPSLSPSAATAASTPAGDGVDAGSGAAGDQQAGTEETGERGGAQTWLAWALLALLLSAAAMVSFLRRRRERRSP